MRSAIVNKTTNIIENIILANPETDDNPYGANFSMILLDNQPEAQIGWVLENGVFVDPTPPPEPVIPTSVSPRQVRLLLLQQGLLSQVETMIAGLDQASQITWEFAIEFHRDDPLLNALGAQLGLTEEQIDQFFIEAAAL